MLPLRYKFLQCTHQEGTKYNTTSVTFAFIAPKECAPGLIANTSDKNCGGINSERKNIGFNYKPVNVDKRKFIFIDM